MYAAGTAETHAGAGDSHARRARSTDRCLISCEPVAQACPQWSDGKLERLRAARRMDVTDDERQKAEALISRLEIAIGEIFPRDGSNSGLIASMIQSLNGLRSVLGIVRAH